MSATQLYQTHAEAADHAYVVQWKLSTLMSVFSYSAYCTAAIWS